MLREWVAVALGGMLGTLARHALNQAFRGWNPNLVPVSTLLVNVVGCFAIGFIAKWAMDRETFGHWMDIALRVGFLGGLTTFSTFGFEVIRFGQTDRIGLSVALVAAHMVLGLLAVVFGMSLAAKTI